MNKRIQKRWKRENRKNKGANAEARLTRLNAETRRQRDAKRDNISSDPGMEFRQPGFTFKPSRTAR